MDSIVLKNMFPKLNKIYEIQTRARKTGEQISI